MFLMVVLILMVAIWIPVAAREPLAAVKVNFKIEPLPHGCRRVTDGAGRVLLLVPRGQSVPKGFKGIQVVRTPVRRVVFTSPTQVCFLRCLKENPVWESVVGVTIPEKQWYIPEIKQGLRQGRIAYLGDSFKPDFERLQALRPELVLVYSGAAAGQMGLIKKLQELGIPYAVDNEYLEADPLARLEWLRFITAFYGQDQVATAFLANSRSQIGALQHQFIAFPRPKVAWGVIYQGRVYVPAGNSYAARMIALAGGEYIFKDKLKGQGGVNIGIEEFYKAAREAEILIYTSFPEITPRIATILKAAPALADLKAIRQQRVWSLQPWYYQSLDQSSGILLDLAAIFHPELYRGRQINYYSKLP